MLRRMTMAKNDFEVIGVGTIVKDLNGYKLMVVERADEHAVLKYVDENGELSRGSVFAVPSHFDFYKVVELHAR
ncbi:MAG: hypothetical protein J6R68_06500 [Clostridia bacterium]|nr:hypothetical protein [Clostridia bacterium]